MPPGAFQETTGQRWWPTQFGYQPRQTTLLWSVELPSRNKRIHLGSLGVEDPFLPASLPQRSMNFPPRASDSDLFSKVSTERYNREKLQGVESLAGATQAKSSAPTNWPKTEKKHQEKLKKLNLSNWPTEKFHQRGEKHKQSSPVHKGSGYFAPQPGGAGPRRRGPHSAA